MFKKYIALLFLCISNLIIIGHGIIPHKHSDHTTHTELALHNESDHHGHDHHHNTPSNEQQNSDEHDEEHSVLGDLFSNFAHAGSYFPESGNQTIKTTVVKDTPSAFTITSIISIAKDEFRFSIDQRNHCWHDKPIYISPHCLSSGLRAPPVSFS